MRKILLVLTLLGGAASLMPGCPAAHDEYPGLACKQDSDCYLGETCQNLVCAGMDMSVPTDMAFPKFDFARPDLLDSDGDQPMPDLTGGGDM